MDAAGTFETFVTARLHGVIFTAKATKSSDYKHAVIMMTLLLCNK
jgi:hypothetical protein